MGTTLSDIIVPELLNPYVIQKTLEKSALVQSGIVQNDAEFDKLASQASPLVNMPFFSDLTGESETVIEGDDLTADKISSKKDVAVILRRAKMWSATDLSAAMSGADPMAAIASLVSDFWVRDLQKELIAVLKGIFGTIPAVSDGSPKEAETRLASNILDMSSASGNGAKWSGSAFIDAQQLLGDNKAELTAVVMHSAVEAALRKQDLIDVIQPSGANPFSTYMGKRVIIDDGCPVTGSGSSQVFSTYLFGNGAIALGNGTPKSLLQPKQTEIRKRAVVLTILSIVRRIFFTHAVLSLRTPMLQIRKVLRVRNLPTQKTGHPYMTLSRLELSKCVTRFDEVAYGGVYNCFYGYVWHKRK